MTTIPGSHLGIHPLLPRDPNEPHRTASPLELMFDLVFVVAVSVSAVALHEVELEGHVGAGVTSYLMLFFAIWWAWMTVSWFATSFATDDWLYRVGVIVQMAGALTIAAGARAGILEGDFTWVVIGYVVMRLVSVPQWIRVAVANPEYRRTATVYAVGIVAIQALWIGRQPMLPEWMQVPSFLFLVLLEVTLPAVAEQQQATPWHPHHMAERFGLFTIILLGESILASSNAILAAIEGSEEPMRFITIAGLGLVIVAAMWWTYFSRPVHPQIGALKASMVFGYFHYVIFASAGAFSAGIEVAVAAAQHEVHLDEVAIRSTLTVPVALFLISVWWLTLRHILPMWATIGIVTLAIVCGASALVPASLLITAIACIVIVVILEVTSGPPSPVAGSLKPSKA